MRVRSSLPALFALAAALIVGPAWGHAQTGMKSIPAPTLLAQNQEPPVQVVPTPHAMPGDFENRRSRDQGPKAPRFDAVKARKDAQQLAALAQTIPSQVDQLSKDQLNKDLLQNLKQIQKLAKRLRSEIPH